MQHTGFELVETVQLAVATRVVLPGQPSGSECGNLDLTSRTAVAPLASSQPDFEPEATLLAVDLDRGSTSIARVDAMPPLRTEHGVDLVAVVGADRP